MWKSFLLTLAGLFGGCVCKYLCKYALASMFWLCGVCCIFTIRIESICWPNASISVRLYRPPAARSCLLIIRMKSFLTSLYIYCFLPRASVLLFEFSWILGERNRTWKLFLAGAFRLWDIQESCHKSGNGTRSPKTSPCPANREANGRTEPQGKERDTEMATYKFRLRGKHNCHTCLHKCWQDCLISFN